MLLYILYILYVVSFFQKVHFFFFILYKLHNSYFVELAVLGFLLFIYLYYTCLCLLHVYGVWGMNMFLYNIIADMFTSMFANMLPKAETRHTHQPVLQRFSAFKIIFARSFANRFVNTFASYDIITQSFPYRMYKIYKVYNNT